MLDVKNLVISTDSTQIVHGVNLHIDKAERVGLIGGSGSGKSLIAQAILGILPQYMHVEGEILINGINVQDIPEDQRAELRGTVMSAVFQNPLAALNPVTTVEKNIELPLKLHYSLSPSERQDRVRAALEYVGLETRLLQHYPSQLSGGQAQRVAIAEALISYPQLLIADEPTTALDSLVQQRVIDVLMRRTEEQSAAVLVTSHDFNVISRVAQRCYVIHDGRIVEESDIDTIVHHPQHEYTRQLVHAARELAVRDDTDMARGE